MTRTGPHPATKFFLPGRYQPVPWWLERCHACPPPRPEIPHTCGKELGMGNAPSAYEWNAVAQYAAQLELEQILFGYEGPGLPRRDSYLWRLDREDPHAGLSAGTRRGKTNWFLVVAMQVLAKGGRVIGIDPKLVSLEALEGLPGCMILNDPWNVGEMWAAIAGFYREIQWRSKVRKADRSARFDLLLLIIDELNLFSELSALEWESRSGPQPEQWDARSMGPWGGKKKPPMWNDLAMGLWTGAQFNAHYLVAGQRFDQRSTGNRGLRDSFGIRGAAGVPANQVDMLFGPGEGRRVTFPNIRGRFYFGQGEERAWVQVPRVVDPVPEVRDYVLSHRPPSRSGAGTVVARNQLSPAASSLRRSIGCTPVVGGRQPPPTTSGSILNVQNATQRRPIAGRVQAWAASGVDSGNAVRLAESW